jgi:hypothetical protein
MASEAQRKARNKYNKENIANKVVSFNKNTEADLLEWVKDKTFGTYVKNLIRADYEAQKNAPGE